ncbi:MAG: flagellin [Armatimonadota bacterium]
MGFSINFNASAIGAHRMMGQTDNALNKSIERLSSGFKINAASDDPAGLVISEKLRAQASGLEMAIKNAADSINMVKTVEASLSEVHTLLRGMRDLAVHASNTGATDEAARAADQAQIASAIASLNKISEETMFGYRKLLNGDAGLKFIQASAAANTVERINLNNVTDRTTDFTVRLAITATASQATAQTGVITGAIATAAGNITINGKYIEWSAGQFNAATATDSIVALGAYLNGFSAETGVAVSAIAAGNLNLTAVEYGSNAKFEITDASSQLFNVSSVTAGKDVKGVVTDGDGRLIGGIWNKGSGTILKDNLGNEIQLKAAAATSALMAATTIGEAKTAGTLIFQVGAYAGQTRGANIASTHSAKLGEMTLKVNGTDTKLNVAKIDVSTFEGAQNAIKILDKAITDISNQRASLGSLQKQTLESSMRSLGIAKENIMASESTIRDTDMAAEMVTFTKNQILQQAAVSMLAQANQAPSMLLSLIR